MLHSDSLDQIGPALVAAQAALKPVEKSAENPHFRSKYAPLEDILAEAQRVCHPNGLFLSQSTADEDESGFTMLTTILHAASGQWIRGRMRVPLEKPTPQAAGSAATYSRRFGLVALLGMRVGDPDDDGNIAETSSKPARAAARVENERSAPPVRIPQTHSVPDSAYEPPKLIPRPERPGAKLGGVEGLAAKKADAFGGFLLQPLTAWDDRNLHDAREYFGRQASDEKKKAYRAQNQANAALIDGEIERRELSVEPASLLGGPEPWDER